ncbi:hypothetical protein NPIL_230331 [Nephila pilipes]|uniref:Uncharacterized protein n=1 Tax=Nephila pilipes TaxID=299642 RepID=A0A8X6TJ84_NEPPI|nr:hypothetical protein NPIL_230331 [Nephila pilipes]
MDMIEQDRNTEACLQRALKESHYAEIVSNYLKCKVLRHGMPVRKDNIQERQELEENIHKDLIAKIKLEEDLKILICPKLCDFHQIAIEIEKECYKRCDKILPPNTNPGTKMKAPEKEGFRSPTKTSKQPRKEKFKIPTSNQFEEPALPHKHTEKEFKAFQG